MKKLFLIKEYFYYLIRAKSAHGIHSPFVFDFICSILKDKRNFYCFEEIEKIKTHLYQTKETVEVEDFGAGSHASKSNIRSVQSIAKNAGRNRKYGTLLFRIINHYNFSNILELGTSLGIATMYMAKANKNAHITTLEGSKNIATISTDNFKLLQLQNITQVLGNFDTTLLHTCKNSKSPFDFVFIDGNHRYKPTIEYFEILKKYSTSNTMLVFDDIHWSKEMKQAWEEIKKDAQITMTIDLFYFGIVLFKKEFKEKEHFILRY